MPVVRIDIQAGKSTAYKREILQSVRAGIIEALGVAPERVMQRIIETPAENIDFPSARPDHLTIIEISMLPGRSAALKQAMYGAIVAHLGEKPGIHHHDITVLVNDPSAECFAIGGVMQCTLPGAPLSDDEFGALEPEPVAPEPVAEPEPASAPEPAPAPTVEPEPRPEPALTPDAAELPDATEEATSDTAEKPEDE